MNLLVYTVMLMVNRPAEMIAALSCALVLVSCLLLLNHMRGGFHHWPEKLIIVWISFGAFGGMVAPLCGILMDPTWAELMFYTGAASFSTWLTLPYWRELHVFDRRATARQRVAHMVDDDEEWRVT